MSNKLAKRTVQSVKTLIDDHKNELKASMPNQDAFGRFRRTILYAIASNEKLSECSPASIFLSSAKIATTDLVIGEQAHLVPYYNNDKKTYEAKPLYDYKGLIELCYRSGKIKSLYACLVYKNDEFNIQRGTEQRINHNPDPFADRGDLIGAYAVAKMKSGEVDFEVMSIEELEKIRATAKTDFIWKKNTGEMYKKTVLKRLMKRLPRSYELMEAMEIDNKQAMGERHEIVVKGIEVDDKNDNLQGVQSDNMKGLEESLS